MEESVPEPPQDWVDLDHDDSQQNQPHNDSVGITANWKPAFLLRLASELIFVGAGLNLSVASALSEELKESRTNEIGYPTVAAALGDLRNRPGVQISQQGGWTVINDAASATVWSFTPPGHPAHPSAVKRAPLFQEVARPTST